MKRTYILILLFLVSIATLLANNTVANDSATTAALQEINRIKLDPEHYIYAESTMKDWIDAYESAKLLLKEKLTAWLQDNNDSDVSGCIAKSDEILFELKAKRGDKYRAFVYLKKSDVISFSESRQVLTVNVPPKPKVEKEQTSPYQVEVKKDEKVLEQKVPVAKVVSPVLLQQEQPYVLTNMEKSMLLVKASADIRNYIMEKKEKGIITNYGKYAERPSTGEYYLFVYNSEGEIPACLKSNDGKLINLATCSADSFEKYKGCGAIWFTIK